MRHALVAAPWWADRRCAPRARTDCPQHIGSRTSCAGRRCEDLGGRVYGRTGPARQKAYEAFCTRCHGLDLLGSKNAGSGPALKDVNFWVSWSARRSPASSARFSARCRDSPVRSATTTTRTCCRSSCQERIPRRQVGVGCDGRGGYPRHAARQHREARFQFRLVQVVGCLTKAPTAAGC
jgi:hypothetical protein